jgi:hypothetical protein
MRATRRNNPALAVALALALLAIVSAILAGAIVRLREQSQWDSDRYGYSMNVPDGWNVIPANAAWGPGPLRVASSEVWDVVDGPEGSLLLIASAPVPSGTDAEAWAAANVGRHPEMKGSNGQERCSFGLGLRVLFHQGAGTFEFRSGATLAKRGAVARAACGYVDAVVAAGDRMYVIVLDTRQETGGDWELFERLTSSLEFRPETARNDVPSPSAPTVSTPAPSAAPSAAPPLGPTFASARYGYTVQYPAGWEAMPVADDVVVPGDPLRVGPVAYDQFVDPASGEVMWIFAQPIPSGLDVTTWAESRVPLRGAMTGEPGGHRHCEYRSGGGFRTIEDPWSPTLTPFEVGDALGLFRAACIYVDGIVIGRNRAVVVRLSGPEPMAGFRGEIGKQARLALFHDVVRTLQFE